MRVNSHGQDDGLADRHDLQALFLDDVVHVRLVLHGVHVQIAFGQGLVRLDIVVKFDDFDGDTLFSCFFCDFFHDFRVGTGSDAHLDFFFITGSTGIGRRTAAGGKEARRRDEDGGEEFFYCCIHVIISFLDDEYKGLPVKKKSRHTDDGSICDSFICRYIPLDLAPIPIGGCRSVIGPFPRLLLMKDNVLLLVYMLSPGGESVKKFLTILRFLRKISFYVIIRKLIGGLYSYGIEPDKMSLQSCSGGRACT